MKNISICVTAFRFGLYNDHNGIEKRELFIDCETAAPLNCAAFTHAGNCFMRVSGNTARLRVPVIEGELKRFYENYTDYYYLPAEDMAIHKSVSSFVDRKRRRNATAKTCYTRHYGIFLPQWDNVFPPVFKRDFGDSISYFLYSEEWEKESAAKETYAAHVIRHLTDITLAD